jgi:restriction system protein
MKSLKHSIEDLINPCMEAFRKLDGSGTNSEIEEQVIKLLDISEDEQSDIHRGSVTKLNYRLRWVRNWLKNDGLLENTSRAVWALTENGRSIKTIDIKELRKRLSDRHSSIPKDNAIDAKIDNATERELDWQEEALDTLKNINPESFEHLSAKLLRLLGLRNLEVTSYSNDGGIDGYGDLMVGSIISLSVAFQCKRYKGKVGASDVRDFRGGLLGRADKGVIITTGMFTKGAEDEARRDGVAAINLLDGFELVEKLKDVGLGICEKTKVEVDKNWFMSQ